MSNAANRPADCKPARSVAIGLGVAHIRQIKNAGTRRVRKMVQSAVSDACQQLRNDGYRPISMVDDLTMHSLGRWIDTFGKCLTRSAKREGISVTGGEMAQMPDTYRRGYVGVAVSVVGVKP